MQEKDTEELLAIYAANDREAWTTEAFDVIRDVLIERGAPGLVTSQKLSSPLIPAAETDIEQRYLFLYIPVWRLIFMSILSFGLYERYWMYMNWRYVKERDSLNMRPFWRAVFAIFYCHSLLRRIHEDNDSRAMQVPLFPAGSLATGWVILSIVSNLLGSSPDIAVGMLAAFIPTFLCLVPVQNYINSVGEQRSFGRHYHPWPSGHFILVVLGIITWALILTELVAK